MAETPQHGQLEHVSNKILKDFSFKWLIKRNEPRNLSNKFSVSIQAFHPLPQNRTDSIRFLK